MDLLKLLESAGGAQSLGSLAGSLGLDSSKTNDLVAALAPALLGGLEKQVKSDSGLSDFKEALQSGNHQQYLQKPDLMSSLETLTDGNNILSHLLGSKDASRNAAAQAAESTGIDVSLIKKALPMLAGLAMGAMSKGSNAGSSSSLNDLIGGLMGESSGIDDVIDLAKKFF